MVCATAKQVVNRAVARYLCDLYWSLCSHESWAANQLGTFNSKLRGVELVAGSVINWAGHGGSALQEMLEYLVENRPESWTYVIKWQLSSIPTGSDMWVFVSLNTLSPFFTSSPAISHSFPTLTRMHHFYHPAELFFTEWSLSNDFCCMLLYVILDFSK
jgi:hypothetical protein